MAGMKERAGRLGAVIAGGGAGSVATATGLAAFARAARRACRCTRNGEHQACLGGMVLRGCFCSRDWGVGVFQGRLCR